LDRLEEDLSEIAIFESRSRLEGNSMYMIIAPSTGVPQPKGPVKEKSVKKPTEAVEEAPSTETVAEETSEE
jgi:hypothetical protein